MEYKTEGDAADFEDFARFMGNLRALGRRSPAGLEGRFAEGSEAFVARCPGRLDLMGGNDDYTGGLVFEATIKEAVIVAVVPRADRKVLFYNPAVAALGWEAKVEFSIDDLLDGGKPRPTTWVRAFCEGEGGRRSWCAYILGDFYYLLKNFPDAVRRGFDLYMESDIPLGKGVSSSAAIEVGPMKAMAASYGIEARGVELALWTQWVEIALTGAACGVMDQLAVAMGGESSFIPMLCQPCEPLAPVVLPANLRVWGIDSGVRHSVAGIEYEAARAAAFMGYAFLCDIEGLAASLDESGIVPRYVDPRWDGYLARLSPSLFKERYEARLPKSLRGGDFLASHPLHLDPHTRVLPEIDYPVLGATRYAVEENWRVSLFYEITAGNSGGAGPGAAKALGELMYAAHLGYTDCGLASDATDLLVRLARREAPHGVLGAKITGGGAGGTVAFLGYAGAEAEEAIRRIAADYRGESGLEPYLFDGSSPGADAFGVFKARL